jgi:protein-S-isoprenylcysteine O-methyltransferase Ste14
VASPNSGGDGAQVPPVLPSIPLSPETSQGADGSIGGLVKDATTHVSTLIRSEVELAKSEVAEEVKKGVKGSVFFVVALVIVLYSLFFFFFFVAELLQYLLLPWASYLVVFGLMLLTAGLFAFLGYQKVRKLRAPERTISSVKDTASTLSKRGGGPPSLER